MDKIQVKHVHTIFRNEQNGYTVAKFITYDDQEEDILAVGFFSSFISEMIYNLEGEYVDHPSYGEQFKVNTWSRSVEDDDQSMIRYFSSVLFPGIGKKSASSIVEAIRDYSLKEIQEDVELLDHIDTISSKHKSILKKGLLMQFEDDAPFAFYAQLGISVNMIKKIEAVYMDKAIKQLKDNPYQLVYDVDGISFSSIDRVAKILGIDSESDERTMAFVYSKVVDMCFQSGDTYVLKDEFIKKINSNIGAERALSYLDKLFISGDLVEDVGRIYTALLHKSEIGIANYLLQLLQEQRDYFKDDITRVIEDVQNKFNIEYESEQKKAIHCFFENSISILTGGPGTGKTTIVEGILETSKTIEPSTTIACCAPTGRAAKRLSSCSNAVATTIHSLLKWDLESNTFLVNEKDPLNYDIVLIDEFSMVDTTLFYNLLLACKNVKKLYLIGDEDQLPSVGSGSVLSDLIASKKIPFVRLEKIFRQKEGSDVITLAHEIKDEHITCLHDSKDLAFFNCTNIQVKDRVTNIVANALAKGYQEMDIQILAPMYQGVAGIDALNVLLQSVLNPPSDKSGELIVGHRIFREHDKVLQLKNQPEDNVFNGDIGKIAEIDNAKRLIIVDFDGNYVTYQNEQLFQLTHGYCISIHKAQGSEYNIVIVPVVKDYYYMLQKRLLYTAITRARKSLILLGDEALFIQSIKLKDKHIRKTTLQLRLNNISETI